MSLLSVVPFGSVPVRPDGRISLTDKFLSGIQGFQDRWPGDVVVLSRPAQVDDSGNLGSQWIHPQSLSFDIHLVDAPAQSPAARQADVVLGSLAPEQGELLAGPAPVVFSAENPGHIHQLALKFTAGSRLDYYRGALGYARRERRLRKMVRHSAGIQCNGKVAWESYSNLTESSMVYYDSRINSEIFHNASKIEKIESPVTRLAFSGRLLSIKGAEYLVPLCHALRDNQIEFSLSILGDGALKPHLIRELEGMPVQFLGDLPFATEWIEYVSSSVDLMVLPHVLGDPSGTFLEAAACGVPIAGFDSAALNSLTTDMALGRVSPVGNSAALSDMVIRIINEPGSLNAMGSNGRGFMNEHLFETEWDQRVDHLLNLARRR